MTIWLPRWPVQRRLVEKPEWRKRPVFVCRREKRGLMTVMSWAWAEPPARRRAAIRPGMSLAEAMAVLALAYGSQACHAAEVDADDPAADAEALRQLARACRRFAPLVGVETVPLSSGRKEACPAATAECLHLDVTGTAGFFGGEGPLARTAVWTLAARGLHARVAIADTPAAARTLGVGKRTVQELVADRKLACIKIGRAVRFDPADLRAFVESNRVKAAGWKGAKP